MPDRFRAFSFVDRVTELEPGNQVRGVYRVPAHLEKFPPSLIAEAVGQLAAWAAMDQLDYRVRPVAGIAMEARFLGDVDPGQTLELGVELEACSEDDVVYSGRARVDGKKVLALEHCLGPMLPMTTFDDPELVRARLRVLQDGGTPENGFVGVKKPVIAVTEHASGARLKGELSVPEDAPFFGDHFPRRAVYPATLLLDAMTGVACRLAGESQGWTTGAPITLLRVLNMKMRSFIAPGAVLEVQVDVAPPESDIAKSKLVARLDGRTVATARAEFGHRREES